jgi:hypothetical protein
LVWGVKWVEAGIYKVFEVEMWVFDAVRLGLSPILIPWVEDEAPISFFPSSSESR